MDFEEERKRKGLLQALQASLQFQPTITLQELVRRNERFSLFPSLALRNFSESKERDWIKVYHWEQGSYKPHIDLETWNQAEIPGAGQILILEGNYQPDLLIWDQAKGYKPLLRKITYSVDSLFVIPSEERKFHLILLSLEDEPSRILEYDSRSMEAREIQKLKFDYEPQVLGVNLFAFGGSVMEYKDGKYRASDKKVQTWKPELSMISRTRDSVYYLDEVGNILNSFPERTYFNDRVAVSETTGGLTFHFLVGNKFLPLFSLPQINSELTLGEVYRLLPPKKERDKKSSLLTKLTKLPSSLSNLVVDFCIS